MIRPHAATWKQTKNCLVNKDLRVAKPVGGRSRPFTVKMEIIKQEVRALPLEKNLTKYDQLHTFINDHLNSAYGRGRNTLIFFTLK